MLKEALEYLMGLRETRVSEINGETYANEQLYHIEPVIYRPDTLAVTSLDALVGLVKHELDQLGAWDAPLFLRADVRCVDTYTTPDEVERRSSPYRAVCDAPDYSGGWMDHETAIIRLRSLFVQDAGDDLDYLLDLLGSISRESAVSSSDNGVSQTVEARQGVALKTTVRVRSRVRLTPYRTFLEVRQPTSEFLLRLDKEGRVGILSADGDMWKTEARRSVAEYLRGELAEEISAGRVAVLA